METLIIYAIKASVSIAFFYLLHIIFLKGETFLGIRRVYLLFALFFSLLFPFINLASIGIENNFAIMPAINLNEIIITAQDTAPSEINENSSQFNLLYLPILVCIIGSIILLGKFIFQLLSLAKIIRKGRLIENKDGIRTLEIKDDNISTFSFFCWIVLNEHDINESNITDIMIHERTHAKHLHSLDIILYELFCIVFWWNPFAWLMKNEVKLNLEYLADQQVVSNRTDYREYQYTLLQISIANTGMAFINNFNVSHLKKRIIMMNKKRSPILAMAKYLMILPLALILMYINTDMAEAKEIPDNKVEIQQKKDTPQKKDKLVYEVVAQMPSFPDGDEAMMKFIAENLRYPTTAQKAKAEGRVIVRFIVDEEGNIKDTYILRNATKLENSLDEIVVVGYNSEGKEEKQTITLKEAQEAIEEECLRVVEAMPKWIPGEQNGEKVPVYFNLPVLFRLK